MKRRCQLCGGKLSNNVCTECGLDNSKSDAMYEQEKSSCKEEALTHVHGDHEDPYAGKTLIKAEQKRVHSEKAKKQKNTNQTVSSYSMNQAGTLKKKQGKKGGTIGVLIAILGIAATLMSTVLDNCGGESYETESQPKYSWEEESEEVWTDPYEYATRELSETGEYYETTLTAGVYKCGVHIPEGNYYVRIDSGSGRMVLDDEENSIYLEYEMSTVEDMPEETVVENEDGTEIYLGEDYMTEVMDVRIYEGAILEIEDQAVLFFQTDNAQMNLTSMANPITGSWELADSFTAGEDLPAGVYDATCIKGAGIFDYEIDRGDEFYSYEGKLIGTGASGFTETIKNIVLPEGTTVTIEGMTVQLTPSEIIESEDYASFYPEY